MHFMIKSNAKKRDTLIIHFVSLACILKSVSKTPVSRVNIF